ncbi:hypothetical protein FO519_003198 [Halicephalobus sp. NKZ332]|nr:hypothetical protein FO519_003198 [Halicephalobus sp. NKZ332]
MAGVGGLGLKEDLVELALDIDALVAQTTATFLDCAKTRQADGNLVHVTNLFYNKADLFRKLVRRVNVREETEQYVQNLEKRASNLNQIVVEKAADTQEAFNVLAASSFLAKKTLSKAEQESKYVEPEEIVRFSHLISKNFSVCSPHFWQQGDPMRPFPTDMQFRGSLLAQSEGISSPKELHEDISESASKTNISAIVNSHDGGLRDLKMNELPVLNDYLEVPVAEATTPSNETETQNDYNIGLISSDEDSSDNLRMASPLTLWNKFFRACHLPPTVSSEYAANFVRQRIQPVMLKDLSKAELRELGIETVGDQLAILKHIRECDGVPPELSDESPRRVVVNDRSRNMDIDDIPPPPSRRGKSAPDRDDIYHVVMPEGRNPRTRAILERHSELRDRGLISRGTTGIRVSGRNLDRVSNESKIIKRVHPQSSSRIRPDDDGIRRRIAPSPARPLNHVGASRFAQAVGLNRQRPRISFDENGPVRVIRRVADDALVEEMAAKADQRIQSSLVRQLKAIGASVGEGKLMDKVVEWISRNSSLKNNLSDLNIVLFDSHSSTLASKLIEKNPRSVFLLEGSQLKAQKQKEFVEKVKKQEKKVEAFHAAMTNVLIPSKSRPVNTQFWNLLTEPMQIKPEYKNYDTSSFGVKTVMLGCLPFPNQQKALLDALMEQLLLYYLIQKPKRNPRNEHFSFVFNSFFEVKLLSELDGFELGKFNPEIPLTLISEKKSSEIGLKEDKLYPVQIEPKQFLDFNFDGEGSEKLKVRFDSEEDPEKRRIPIDFALWMDITGKFNKKTMTSDMSGRKNLSTNPNGCMASPFSQLVHVPGCETKFVLNRFCHGTCSSFYVPQLRSKKLKANFENFTVCRPAEVEHVQVKLECEEGQITREITRIKRCACVEHDAPLPE